MRETAGGIVVTPHGGPDAPPSSPHQRRRAAHRLPARAQTTARERSPRPWSPPPASRRRRTACPPRSPSSPARTSRNAATARWPRRWTRCPACGWCRPAASASRPAPSSAAAASRQVLVLLDGVPLNDPSEPNGAFNFGNELLGDIERIEVVRGPASSLYGSGAVGGVMNMITRRAPANTPFQAFGEGALRDQPHRDGEHRRGRHDGTLELDGDGPGPVHPRDRRQRAALQRQHRRARQLHRRRRDRAARLPAGCRQPGARGCCAGGRTRSGLDNVPRDDPNNELTDRRCTASSRPRRRSPAPGPPGCARPSSAPTGAT